MKKTQDPIELMEAWHANECLGMLDRLMHGIPPEGGNVSKDAMEQLLATAFLTGAICQQDRPLLAVVPFPLHNAIGEARADNATLPKPPTQ